MPRSSGNPRRSRPGGLRFALAALLALHLGLGQAMTVPFATDGRSHFGVAVQSAEPATTTAVARPETAATPCHGAPPAASSSSTDDAGTPQQPPAQHDCCDPGHCHCAASCALPQAAPPAPMVDTAVRFTWAATPVQTHGETPDLRPPIH